MCLRDRLQQHHVFELGLIHLPEGPLLRLLQCVGAVLFQPRGSLGTGQAHGCLGAQRPRGFIDAFPVPIQTFHFLSGTGSLQVWRPSSFPNHSTKKRKENLFPFQSYPRTSSNIQFRVLPAKRTNRGMEGPALRGICETLRIVDSFAGALGVPYRRKEWGAWTRSALAGLLRSAGRRAA